MLMMEMTKRLQQEAPQTRLRAGSYDSMELHAKQEHAINKSGNRKCSFRPD